jgi:hypothetical protein
MDLWISTVKKLPARPLRGRTEAGNSIAFGGYPPSPYPLNGLLGAGLAKSARKILRGEGLGVKI